jgi:acetate kinase
MHPENKNILAVNGGSSSIKFALYATGPGVMPSRLLSGKIDRIGLSDAKLTYTDSRNDKKGELAAKASSPGEAAAFLLGWLEQQGGGAPAAIGHRVVHGLQHRQASVIDEALLSELRRIEDYDPDHLPGEIQLIGLFRKEQPEAVQVACFDTAFHAALPRHARLLPLPRRYDKMGLQKYGFHGLSYAYVLEELLRADPVRARGAVILAHLGSGASLAAVKDGVSVDTTMGFTPTGGIVMGTRTGDLDPGVVWYLLQNEGMDAAAFSRLVNHESGLLGVSGISSDMQDLLAREGEDERAAEAVDLFCYQVKKTIGAFAAVLGGLDALVFTGGIGERSPIIRSRICAGLGYLGVSLDQKANEQNALSISAGGCPVAVYAIPTDEEWMIARTVDQLLKER